MKGKFLAGVSVAVIAILVVIASVPVMASQGAAADGMMSHPGGDSMSDHDGMEFEPHDDMSMNQMRERMQQMMNLGEQHNMFGMMDYSDGLATGHFVEFEYDNETGLVTDYSVRTGESYSEIFQSVELVDFVPDDMKTNGSILMQNNDTVRMIVHNNPTAQIHIASNNSSAELSFLTVEDTTVNDVEVEGDLSDVVEVVTPVVKGLIGVGNGSITVDEAATGTYVNVTVNEGQAFFRMKPYFTGIGAHEEDVMNAIAQGKVSNEMAVMCSNEDAMALQHSYQHQYRMEFQEYSQERIRIQVSSDSPEGKVMMLRINNEAMESLGEKVKIDGQEVQKVELDQALNATGDTLDDAVYSLQSGEEYTTLAVYVPHFSTHTLEIGDDGAALPVDSTVLAVVAIAGVALIGVAYAVIRRK